MNDPINRRVVISAVFTLLAADAFARQRTRDRGIGGTGVFVEPDNGDRGIGGTGVIGTIRKFGSIIVNDMRIAYPPSAEVEIDGRTATPTDLRLGQVVQTVATTDGAGFATNRIILTSEVVGPIERVAHGRLTVLGQSVATDYVDAGSLKAGQWIAVSGLRDLDGTIYASYIQHRDDSLAQVAGPVSLKNGVAQIGGLSLVNLDTALDGRRVLAQVGRLGGLPAAVSVLPDPELAAMPNVRRLSIETYVARAGGDLRMGSGLTATAAPSQVTTSTAPARAVVAVTVSPDGGMTETAWRPIAAPQTTPKPDRRPRTAQQKTTSSDAPANRKAENNPDKKSAKDEKTQRKEGADDIRSSSEREKADKTTQKGAAGGAKASPDSDKTATKGEAYGAKPPSPERDTARKEPTRAPEPPPAPPPEPRRR